MKKLAYSCEVAQVKCNLKKDRNRRQTKVWRPEVIKEFCSIVKRKNMIIKKGDVKEQEGYISSRNAITKEENEENWINLKLKNSQGIVWKEETALE
jgi:ribosomal protein S8